MMKKTRPFKNKFIIAVVAAVVLGGFVISVGVFFLSRANLIAEREEGIKLQTVEQAHEIDRLFSDSARISQTIAAQAEIAAYLQQTSPGAQDDSIVALLQRYDIGLYSAIFVMDTRGIVLASTESLLVGADRSRRSYFRNAAASRQAIQFGSGSTTRKPGYYVASPVYAEGSDVVIGVVAIKIAAEEIGVSLKRYAEQLLGHVMFVDNDGVVTYSDIPDRQYKAIGPLSAEKRREISKEDRIPGGIDLVSLQYEPVVPLIYSYTEPTTIVFSDPVDQEKELLVVVSIPRSPFYIIAEKELADIDAVAARAAFFLSLWVFLGAVFVGFVIYYLVQRFLRPISRLNNAVRAISKGDFAYPIDIHTGDELEELGAHFSAMAIEVRDSYLAMQRLIAQKTKELADQLFAVEAKNKELAETQRAVLNILEDARALEVQVANERDYLKGILESMGEGLFVIDADYRIVVANPIAERILGIAASDLVGKNMADTITIFKGKEKLPITSRPIARVLSEGTVISADLKDDFYWETRTGVRFPVGFVAAPLSIGGVKSEVVIFRNLEHEKGLDDARTSFISITSHQLRTPLTSIKWFLEMLMDGSYADPLTQKQLEFADLAYQAGDKMMGIINLLLQIARVEAKRVRVAPVPTDLKQLTQTIVTSFGNAFRQRGQTVMIVADPDPLPLVSVDVDITGQVIQNLLSNANRYANERSAITISIKAGQVEQGKEFLVYSVADQGIGIGKEAAGRIFEKFYRAENALRAVPEGSGLGLSLVKLLVEGWGGRVWFESVESQGTTFFFTIPTKGMQSHSGEVGIRVD